MTVIEFVRRQKGLTQVKLAKEIGISPSCIVQLERKIRRPWPKIKKQLAEALGFSEDMLFDKNGDCLEIDETFLAKQKTGRR